VLCDIAVFSSVSCSAKWDVQYGTYHDVLHCTVLPYAAVSPTVKLCTVMRISALCVMKCDGPCSMCCDVVRYLSCNAL
jgi:hypothetical protein